MNTDKPENSINTRDLPKQWERTTTQQPEEFIDFKPNEKDENDASQRGGGEVRREKGDQETA